MFSPGALALPPPISDSPGSDAEPNEIWMSVFGGFVAISIWLPVASTGPAAKLMGSIRER